MNMIQLKYDELKKEIDSRGGEESLEKTIGKYSYQGYIGSYIWKTISEYNRQLHPQCEDCGSMFHLQVHHSSYKNLGLEIYHPEDLRVLCSKCHALITFLQNIDRKMCVQWERKYNRM